MVGRVISGGNVNRGAIVNPGASPSMRLHRQSRWYQEAPLKGGEEPCNPQLLLLLVPVPVPLPDSLPESKFRTGTGTGTGTGKLKTPERQSLFESHRQSRWFHEAMTNDQG